MNSKEIKYEYMKTCCIYTQHKYVNRWCIMATSILGKQSVVAVDSEWVLQFTSFL